MPDFASPSFGGFAFIGSLAVLAQFSFRPMTLRRRVFRLLAVLLLSEVWLSWLSSALDP